MVLVDIVEIEIFIFVIFEYELIISDLMINRFVLDLKMIDFY